MKDYKALLVTAAYLCTCLTPSRADNAPALLTTLHSCEARFENAALRDVVSNLNDCIAGQGPGADAAIVINTNPAVLVISNCTTGWTKEFELLKLQAQQKCREIARTILDRPILMMTTTNMSILQVLCSMEETAGVSHEWKGSVIVLNPAPGPLELREYETPPDFAMNGTNGYDKFFQMFVGSVLSEYGDISLVASNRVIVLETESNHGHIAKLMKAEMPNHRGQRKCDPGRAKD